VYVIVEVCPGWERNKEERIIHVGLGEVVMAASQSGQVNLKLGFEG
jgi:hypothetical protein